MNELKDYRNVLAAKAQEVEPFFSKYPQVLPEDVHLFREINNTKVKNTVPEIMVYGIYNAGKSSILNELIGEDLAEVRDVPETDKVTYYEWQGYKLADTPGVSAPIEHEKITETHLKKADIVLFVMSTTGSSEKQDNYDRMKQISEAGKKIIIVLNDKNGDMGRNEEAIRQIKQKVDTNLRRTGIKDVDGKYCIVTVNALRARQGRIKDKSRLIEMSGIDELKDVILTELKTTSSFAVLQSAIAQMEQIIDNFVDNLKDEENSDLLKKMNQVLATFEREKTSIRRQINLYIDLQTDQLAATLPQIIWDNMEKKDELTVIMGHEIEALNTKVQQEVERQITDVVAILSMEMQSFAEVKVDSHSEDAESFKKILEELDNINKKVGEPSVQTLTATPSIGTDEIIATAGTVEMATGIITESGKAVLGNLAKTAMGKYIAKTAAGKILGSIGGTVVPVIGPLITAVSVLGTLKNLLGSNKDYEQMMAQVEAQNAAEHQRIAAAMQARQELNQKCLYLADKLAAELKDSTNNAVNESLSLYENPFRAELVERQKQGAQIIADVDKLRTIKGEYDLLRIELGGR